MPIYHVQVQAIIRKTLTILADTQGAAIEIAHEEFTVENDGLPEYYNQETISVEEEK